MLRFQPDNWLEGLLRPLVLMDPVGYVYFELPAPDLRFAILAVLGTLTLFWRQFRQRVGAGAARLLIGLTLMFYIWTFVTGNGRYFMAGLLAAGPLMVLMIVRLPMAPVRRGFALATLCILQAAVVHQHFSAGQWAHAFWRGGSGLPILDPQPRVPATFITISNLTHSIVAPQFHPESTWINLVGQTHVRPGMFEYALASKALAKSQAKYLVIPAPPGVPPTERRPEPSLGALITLTLERYGLQSDLENCQLKPTHLTMRSLERADSSNAPSLSYWICPVEGWFGYKLNGGEIGRRAQAYARIEARCPRFFPPGGGVDLLDFGQVSSRSYAGADTRLFIDGQDRVLYRYSRAINPSYVGTIDEVMRDKFEIPCEKLPGRYRYPWNHEE